MVIHQHQMSGQDPNSMHYNIYSIPPCSGFMKPKYNAKTIKNLSKETLLTEIKRMNPLNPYVNILRN